ncbi:MAG: thiolase family protein, partial [Bdellovibrionales bacterium]|nr:thiolase family protein [Bdellovibrionales bacterium]
LCAKEKHYTREAQDALAIESYKRAQRAQAEGQFKDEIVSVKVTQGKKEFQLDNDEEPGKAMFEKMPGLRPAFDKEGTITAANASKINDGAAALILASGDKVKQLGLKPLAKIVSQASFAQQPEWFTTAPVGAIKKALDRASLSEKDIDLWEVNEAFAVVSMAAMDAFELSADRVNVNGGAIALGHPIGASGARILTTLLYALKNRSVKRGLATLCIGGGEGAALVVERV